MPPKEATVADVLDTLPQEIKDQALNEIATACIVGEGGFIYSEQGMYKALDLRDRTSMFPAIGEELYSHIAFVMGSSRLEAVQIMSLAARKSLYLRFPKKGRRVLKRSMRIHKKNFHTRSKTRPVPTYRYDCGALYDEIRRMRNDKEK